MKNFKFLLPWSSGEPDVEFEMGKNNRIMVRIHQDRFCSWGLIWTWFRLKRFSVEFWEGCVNASQSLMFLRLFCALVQMQVLMQGVLEKALKFVISNMLLGNACAAGPWTTLGRVGHWWSYQFHYKNLYFIECWDCSILAFIFLDDASPGTFLWVRCSGSVWLNECIKKSMLV